MTKENLISILIGIVFFIVFCGIVYGLFLLKRWFNYEFNYESQVIASMCEHLKPEFFNNPELCR